MTKKDQPVWIVSRLKSFSHAFAGLSDMLSTEHNAWIHALATILALDLAWWLQIDRYGFALVIVAVVLVWVAEAFNTVVEIMANLAVGQRYSKMVKRGKDIAAAAVIMAAIGALGIGLAVLGPPFYHRVAPLLS